MPATVALNDRIESSRLELEDIASELDSLNMGLEASPQRLEQVEDRLSLLYSLLKKHSCSTIAQLISLKESLAGSALDIDSLQEKISSLERERESASTEYEAVKASLHKARLQAAPVFADAVMTSLSFLELEKSKFAVDLLESSDGPSGADSVCFRFASDGKEPVDVAKCASGGEMSRIMLSLKAMMARFTGMPTMIFDEIDTGVSGSVADKMGSLICSMGDSMQVFSITHLPQVAAKGRAHYIVSKSDCDGRTVSTIRKVEGKERIMEIARLLSGSVITDAAIANAQALLSESEIG